MKSLIILAAGVALSVGATIYTAQNVRRENSDLFQADCIELRNKVITRLHTHAQLLRSGSAFFSASDSVTREEWRKFNEREKISKNLPGTQGVGFSLIIPRAHLKQHVQKIHAEGYPEYQIHPPGLRDIYTSIIYIEPFSGRNLRAFGYDMFSEHIRQKAMEMARDSDVAKLSGKVTLIQETGNDVQAGTLMYVPVFRDGMPVNTVQERRRAIFGWVYSPYRMQDFMTGILGDPEIKFHNRIRLKIYDDSISAGSLLYESNPANSMVQQISPGQTFTLPIVFNGTKWQLVFSQAAHRNIYFHGKTLIVLSSGLTISLLLFFLSLVITKIWLKSRMLVILSTELRESESKYRELVENSPDSIIIYRDGIIIFANNESIRMIGANGPGQVIGTPVLKFVHPDSLPVVMERMKKTTRIGTVLPVEEEKFICLDGSTIEVEVKAISITLDHKPAVQLVIRDITERNRSIKALRESEQRYKVLFQTSPSGIMVIDENGIILEANEVLSEISGFTIRELIGSSIVDYATEQDPQDVKNNISRILAGEKMEHEIVNRKKDGTLSMLLLRETAITLPDGRKGVLTVSNDISERKKAEQEMISLNEMLEEHVANRTMELQSINRELTFRIREIEQFTYIASHDLQEPLRTISTYAQLVSEEYGGKLDETGNRYIAFMADSASRMRELIRGVLTYALLGTDSKMSVSECGIIVNEVLTDLADPISKSHARITVHNLPVMHCCAAEMRLLFYNIIANAIKFQFPGVVPLISVSAADLGVEWAISVRDNGIGIQPKDREKVFMIFKRMHKQSDYEGTGMGLALCKKIVELHGGKIWVESVPGAGSTFKFTIPKHNT